MPLYEDAAFPEGSTVVAVRWTAPQRHAARIVRAGLQAVEVSVDLRSRRMSA